MQCSFSLGQLVGLSTRLGLEFRETEVHAKKLCLQGTFIHKNESAVYNAVSSVKHNSIILQSSFLIEQSW